MTFSKKIKDKSERFILSLLSKKQVWAVVATFLFYKKLLTPEIWMAFICIMQGVDTYEKKANIKYNYNEKVVEEN